MTRTDGKNEENQAASGQAALLLSSQFEKQLVEKMTDILSILSKDDALSIFILAKDGLLSEVGTPSKIGLTRKQYYTRLKQLVDLGLLSKYNDMYNQTAFGTVVFQRHVLTLADNIKKSKQLEMVDILKQSSKFGSTDIAGFISKIIDGNNTAIYVSTLADSKSAQMISTFSDMVVKVIEMIEFAQQEVLLVTRFRSDVIINSALKKANAGVNVRVLADSKLVEDYISEAGSKMQVQDKNSNERNNVVANPFYPSKVARRYVPSPFCMLVVDNKHVAIEMVDSKDPNKFKMAIFSVDQGLGSQLKQMFESMWTKGTDSIPQTQVQPQSH